MTDPAQTTLKRRPDMDKPTVKAWEMANGGILWSNRNPSSMADPTQTTDQAQSAKEFATELGDLCKRHGVMLWTAFDTTPMVISPVQPDDKFHYEALWSEDGRCFVIKRVLS